MREMAKKVGLGSYSRDLTADLCNLAAGGKVNPPSAYREMVEKKVAESLPAPDSQGRWSITVRKDGEKTSRQTTNRQEAITTLTDEAMRYHTNVCDFLQSVDLAKFPGGSPLEQAMSLLKLLSKKQGGQGGGEGGEPLPIFSEEKSNPEGVAEQLHDAMDTVDSLTQEEQDMLDPSGANHDIQESPEGDGQRTGNKGLNRLKVAEDLVEGSDKRAMLDISRQLDQFTKMQARRQRLVSPDPAGEEVRTRPIRHLGELQRVAKTAWATRQQNLSFFLYQAITGQLPVRERVTRMERKQAIFVLVDGSGSMSGRKHWKATGVVMNRLKAVLSGDAEVWVSVFDTQLSRVHHASTPAEAREVVKKFAAGNFSGGGTDIAAAVRAAHKYVEDKIKAGEALYRPEIVVLTDEDSSVSSLKKSEVAGTKVHGFAMQVSNPSLVEFARSTGGVGMDRF
jgi:uncharacterized protein with von Willebrand factor type A (vWA) domain